MTTKVILADEIGSRIHDIFAGEHFLLGYEAEPLLYVLSPWISNVEIKGKIPKMGEMSPQIGYTFESMDLAHSILLAKLMLNLEVNLITKSPNKETYSNPAHVVSLLDFLDEIGCNVFVNDNLHSKMLLTRKIAIVGSVNLTRSGLYNQEEIAVSLDDFENLSTLKDYARDVEKESIPYGYTAYHGKIEKVTRGWLYHELRRIGRISRRPYLNLEDLLRNIETVYLENIIELTMETSLPPYLRPQALQDYNGPYASEDQAIIFVKKVLARKEFPRIDFTYKNVKFDFEEFVKQWRSIHFKKKTRQL